MEYHSPRPTFKVMLCNFIKGIKAIIKAAGTSATKQAFACYEGKDLLLADYGLYCHMSAIGATLCAEADISSGIHNTLMSIRKAKGPNGVEMLKSTSPPLPKFEPWVAHVGRASLSLPTLVQRHKANNASHIECKGQRGDGRDLKARHFLLTCPKCKLSKDAEACKLYAAAARVLFCTACKTSATSTKWCCVHGIPWHNCSVHKACGFRCGGLWKTRKPLGSPPSALHFYRERTNKARLQRLCTLGTLGACATRVSLNSASCPKRISKTNQKQIKINTNSPKGS